MTIASTSLLLVAPKRVEWIEEPLPPLGPSDVSLKTVAESISIGTEVPQFLGTARSARPPTYPRMTGYENVAIVTETGRDVVDVRPGDRVVATYGHRTHAVIACDRLVPIPDDIDDRLALLVILSGDVATGIRKLGPALNDPVLVTGAGQIGLLAVFILRTLGAPAVDVIEPIVRRRDLARGLGCRACLAPDDIGSLADEYAGGVECSSRDSAFRILQAGMAEHGTLCVLSDGNIEPLTLTPWFHARQLAVVGSSDCPDYRQHASWFFPRARDAAVPLKAIFDQEAPASNLPEVFAQLASGSLDAVKVFVRYD